VVRLGGRGVAISGKSPHFWTEKYPRRTFRPRSGRISRKSTRPQARSRTRFLSTLRGGSGGTTRSWDARPPDRARAGPRLATGSGWPPKPGRDSPGRVRHPSIQGLRWDGRRFLRYGQATRTASHISDGGLVLRGQPVYGRDSLLYGRDVGVIKSSESLLVPVVNEVARRGQSLFAQWRQVDQRLATI
jgi:hypothetical protein